LLDAHLNSTKNDLVSVPDILIKRLENLGPRFVLLAERSKGAIEKGWQEKLKKADDAELQTHLAKGGNYGVAGGAGLIWIDADEPEVIAKIDAELPPTLTVQSLEAWAIITLTYVSATEASNNSETRKVSRT